MNRHHEPSDLTLEPELTKELLITVGLVRFLVLTFRHELGFSNRDTARLVDLSPSDVSRLSSPKTLTPYESARLASYLGEGEHRS